MSELRWLANSPMGLYSELSPGGGAMPGINPWGNMRGNTVRVLIFRVCLSENAVMM